MHDHLLTLLLTIKNRRDSGCKTGWIGCRSLNGMEDGHGEEIQREATPPSPAEENEQIQPEVRPERVSFTSERRKSIHRQSILYPLATDFLPAGSIFHDTPRKHSSSHSLFPPMWRLGIKFIQAISYEPAQSKQVPVSLERPEHKARETSSTLKSPPLRNLLRCKSTCKRSPALPRYCAGRSLL